MALLRTKQGLPNGPRYLKVPGDFSECLNKVRSTKDNNGQTVGRRFESEGICSLWTQPRKRARKILTELALNLQTSCTTR